MKDHMIAYLTKRIEEVDRYIERFESSAENKRHYRLDLIELRGEKKALQTTLKFVKSKRFA